MAKPKGRDSAARPKNAKRGRKGVLRQVYIFTEGKVTEVEYIELILGRARWARPERRVEHHFENTTVESKYRKPLPMVKEAISVLRRVERRAKEEGLDKERDWNWPQVWVLFDRDNHPGISEAMKLAEQADIRTPGIRTPMCGISWRMVCCSAATSAARRDP